MRFVNYQAEKSDRIGSSTKIYSGEAWQVYALGC